MTESSRTNKATVIKRNPMPMIVNSLILLTNLRYIKLKQALVASWTPKNRPMTGVDKARIFWRNVGILVGNRNPRS